jgi:hypothetical protein
VRRILAALALAAMPVTTTAAMVAAPAGASAVTPAPGPRAPTTGGIGLRLVDVPASASEDPRAHLYIVDHLAPGTVIHRRIEVSNTTADTTRISLYPAAAAIAEGAFLGAEGRTANDLSTWTSVAPRALDLATGERVTAEVTVAVPGDAAPGEQYAVVWAETSVAPASGAGITQVSRVGIRIYLSVGPGGAPAADFTVDSLRAVRTDDGLPTVMATVRNTGGRALDMSGTLELGGGPGGLSAGPFPTSLGTTLAIGDTGSVTVILDERLPAGPWDAGISLRSGLIERSARATLTFPAAGAAPPVPTTAPSPDRTLAVVVGLAALVLAGAGLLYVHRRHRLRRGSVLAPRLAP